MCFSFASRPSSGHQTVNHYLFSNDKQCFFRSVSCHACYARRQTRPLTPKDYYHQNIIKQTLSRCLGRHHRLLCLVQIFSLAPMMEYTDRHMRYLLRLLTKRTVLWTEMVPSTTISYNSDDLNRWLAYSDDVEHPVVLQVQRIRQFYFWTLDLARG